MEEKTKIEFFGFKYESWNITAKGLIALAIILIAMLTGLKLYFDYKHTSAIHESYNSRIKAINTDVISNPPYQGNKKAPD